MFLIGMMDKTDKAMEEREHSWVAEGTKGYTEVFDKCLGDHSSLQKKVKTCKM